MRFAVAVLLVFAAASCSSKYEPPAKPAVEATAPAVTSARTAAQKIAQAPWRIEKLEVTSDFQMTVVLRQPQTLEQLTMRVNPGHLGWHRYTVLQAESPGAIVRFDYRESGYSEADDPEEEQRPEYYLIPVVTSSGSGPSFLKRRFSGR